MQKTILKTEELLKKVEEFKKNKNIDLSSDEDLSIALMNLISIEEHLYFTGMKTDKKDYFNLLNNVREIRKTLLKEIVKEPEGEVWCTSKHLLAASMRLIEVGNKHLKKNEEKKAMMMFENAFEFYSLFWSINLNLIKPDKIKVDKGWRNKFSEIVKKIIDCCKE